VSPSTAEGIFSGECLCPPQLRAKQENQPSVIDLIQYAKSDSVEDRNGALR
ncbi:hypothetical protein L9F63_021760, partial [Diploptera punctata]